MAAFAKGATKNVHLEKIVGLTWILTYHLQMEIWFEWVDSEGNWADSASRGDLTWARENGFQMLPAVGVSPAWWTASLKETYAGFA